VGLLDSTSEEPESKLRRYLLTGIVFVGLMWLGIWWIFRFHKEKAVVDEFMEALIAGDMPKAYQTWKPTSAYTYKDFLEDWGPTGTYGPIKSYRIEASQKRGNATGVTVVVGLSPFSPFPDPKDSVKNYRTKEVRLWVESKDLSLGFAP
jgi:hypothetical protein